MLSKCKILFYHQNWENSTVKKCKVSALKCFLFELNWTFGSEVTVFLSEAWKFGNFCYTFMCKNPQSVIFNKFLNNIFLVKNNCNFWLILFDIIEHWNFIYQISSKFWSQRFLMYFFIFSSASYIQAFFVKKSIKSLLFMCFSQKWSQNVSKLLLFNISVLNHVVMIVKFCKYYQNFKGQYLKSRKIANMRNENECNSKTRHCRGLKFGM